ncbi:MAG: alpha/beta hydrolase [Actinobacteria bacterium]|nr:alpha/beta hydrolase [Actinomycetota bacterium]
MGRATRAAVWTAALAGGAAAGYLAERSVLRPRLALPAPAGPPLGSIAGEVREVRGPDGMRITVESYGPEGAPQIVLSHAWTCTGRVWHEQVLALSDRFRLITYDQPGHGRTSQPRSRRYDLDLFGDSLAAVIDQATAPGPLVLAGHSLGGMTVLNWMRRCAPGERERVRGIVLMSTTSRAAADDVALGFGIHTVARLERIITRGLALVRPETTYLAQRLYRASSDLSFLLTRTFGLAPDADPRYVDFTEQLVLDSDLDMITAVMAPVLTLDEDEALTCVTVPMKVVVGTADKVTPLGLSRRMCDRCPSAELVALPGVGHMAPLEAHGTVNALLHAMASGVLTQHEEIA